MPAGPGRHSRDPAPREGGYSRVLDRSVFGGPGFYAVTGGDPVPPGASHPAIYPRGRETPPLKEFRQLGSLHKIPRVIRTPSEIRAAKIDHKQAFVLGLVDGETDIETLLDAVPMATHDVLYILTELVAQGLVALD